MTLTLTKIYQEETRCLVNLINHMARDIPDLGLTRIGRGPL